MKENRNKHIGEIHNGMKITNAVSTRDADGHLLYECKCEVCGNSYIRRYGTIKYGRASCQHYNFVGATIKKTKKPWAMEKLSRVYFSMISRCYRKKNKSYNFYGARGIKVHKDWIENRAMFERWAISSGYRDGLSIDRIDPNKNYCPENCRWVSCSENSRFKSTTNYICIDGETMSGRQWSERIGKSVNYVNTHIRKNGMDATIDEIKTLLGKQ
jgi:hypothetical protein